jgi:hypothetical protein
MGMHIASKILRTWLWSSLIWGAYGPGHGAWDADQPEPIKRQWPFLQSYGLVCASDFAEADPAPWQAYLRQDEGRAHLADTLRILAQNMGGAQWAANPYIETGFARTNCIGCHQLSPRDVSKTTLRRLRTNNVGDFSFSIARNRDRFIKVLGERSILTAPAMSNRPQVIRP